MRMMMTTMTVMMMTTMTVMIMTKKNEKIGISNIIGNHANKTRVAKNKKWKMTNLTLIYLIKSNTESQKRDIKKMINRNMIYLNRLKHKIEIFILKLISHNTSQLKFTELMPIPQLYMYIYLVRKLIIK